MNIEAGKTIPNFMVAKENYLSKDFLVREKENLWPQVWQVACREQEIPKPGDYVVYDIADDSIIVARNRDGAIVAYHNVCPHRGRRLATGCGTTNQFRCGFHGWTFDTNGKNILVQDRDDWKGALDCMQLDLHHVKVDSWGGFVFVNMNPDCEPLTEYLGVIPKYLGPYEFENMSFRWYMTLHLPANWKVALEAFIEGYHVAATHPQLLPYQGDDYSMSYAHGKHSNFGYPDAKSPIGMPSPRIKLEWPKDKRDGMLLFFTEYERQLKAIFTDRNHKAIEEKLKEIVPEDASAIEVMMAAIELGRQAAEEEGCGFPEKLTIEHIMMAGADWHVFPNCATLPWFDGALWYRSRPNGDDPDSCIFDIWSLKRYAKGQEPPIERQLHKSMDGVSAGQILDQDIANMGLVQKGMKSRAFKAAVTNPLQEVPVKNFHRTLEQYVMGQSRD